MAIRSKYPSFLLVLIADGHTDGQTDGLTKRLIEMRGRILKQLFSQHTWSSVWAEMKLGWGRGNWAGALNANGEMTQTNQQTNRWMDGQTDRHDKL